jgi:hypothetical protein
MIDEIAPEYQPEVAAGLPAASRASDGPVLQIYGQPLLLPRCPVCGQDLQQTGIWALRVAAWPWLQRGGAV